MKKNIESRLRRLAGMSPDKREEMHRAAGNQLWWAKCWNCKKAVTALRRDLDGSNCPHCGANLWKRS